MATYLITAKVRTRGAIGAFEELLIADEFQEAPTEDEVVLRINERGLEVSHIVTIKPAPMPEEA